MFYFTPEGWKVFQNKITFKESKEVYDNETENYTENLKLSELVITEVVLTPEQMQRLELVKNIPSMGADDVKSFVIENVINDDQLIELNEIMKKNKLLSLIKWDELTEEQKAELNDYGIITSTP